MDTEKVNDFNFILTLDNIEKRFHPEIRDMLEAIATGLSSLQLDDSIRESVERSINIFNTMRDDLFIHFRNEEEKYFPLFRLVEGDFFQKRREIKNAVKEFDFEHDMIGESFFDKQLEVVDLILPVKKVENIAKVRRGIRQLEDIILGHLKMELAVGNKVKEKLAEMEKTKND